jgi:hypothetical protein
MKAYKAWLIAKGYAKSADERVEKERRQVPHAVIMIDNRTPRERLAEYLK